MSVKALAGLLLLSLMACSSTENSSGSSTRCELALQLNFDEQLPDTDLVHREMLNKAFKSVLSKTSDSMTLTMVEADLAQLGHAQIGWAELALQVKKAWVSRGRSSITANIVIGIPGEDEFYRGTEFADLYWWGNSPEEVLESAFSKVLEEMQDRFALACSASKI